MVFMNTKDDKNNKRLKELVEGAELSQPAALKLFNKGFGIRGSLLVAEFFEGALCVANPMRPDVRQGTKPGLGCNAYRSPPQKFPMEGVGKSSIHAGFKSATLGNPHGC